MSDQAKPSSSIVLFSMLYISLFFASVTVGYKIVHIGNSLYCASVLIFPLLFPFSDALTEIYGVKLGKSLVYYTVLCELIFVALTNTAIRLPSPSTFSHQADYDFLVGGYVHIFLANSIALLVSFYLNVFYLDKWRILLKGKYYFLRSLGATAIGEIAYTLITNIIAYAGILKLGDIANIIVSDYLFKMIYSIIIAYPAALLVTHLRLKYSNKHLNTYNPFLTSDVRKVVSLSTLSNSKSEIYVAK